MGFNGQMLEADLVQIIAQESTPLGIFGMSYISKEAIIFFPLNQRCTFNCKHLLHFPLWYSINRTAWVNLGDWGGMGAFFSYT